MKETLVTASLEFLDTDGLGNKFWRNKHGKLHRENGLPACEFFDGYKYWYKNGFAYRFDNWMNSL